MILYDKNAKFIGMSTDVIHFLGYEDITKFMMYNNDVADLFIKKSNYIYKFENFSWIDYVLCGGTPNKKVIVKLKNGDEIETPIFIQEIIPSDENDNSKMYAVTLQEVLYRQGKTVLGQNKNDLPEKKAIFSIDNDFGEEIIDNIDNDFEQTVEKPSLKLEQTFENEKPSILQLDNEDINDDMFTNEEENKESSVQVVQDSIDGFDSDEVTNLMKKLFINETSEDDEYVFLATSDNEEIIHEPVISKETISETKEALDDLEKLHEENLLNPNKSQINTVVKLKFSNDSAIDQNIQEKFSEKSEENTDIIDIIELSETLGINKEIVKDYIKDYILFAKTKVSELKSLTKDTDIKKREKIILKLIGIGSNLGAEKINNKLHDIYNNKKDNFKELLVELEKDILDLKYI